MKNSQYVVCSILFVLALQQLMAQQVFPYAREGWNKDNISAPKIKDTLVITETVVLKISGTDTLKTLQKDTVHKQHDPNHKVMIYGISSAEALQFDKLAVAGSICAGMHLKSNLMLNVSFNFGTTAVEKENADSVPLSLFYFPDVANTAFAAGIDLGFQEPKNGHYFSIATETSIQRRNIKRDSSSFDFGIVNVNCGPKYRWIYSSDKHNTVFTLGAFYNYVRINRNNTDAFNTLFNDYTSPSAAPVKRYFHGFSLMTALQLDDVTVFARTYTDLSQSGDLAFTVGIKASAEFFSF